jgi:hypothetical protein
MVLKFAPGAAQRHPGGRARKKDDFVALSDEKERREYALELLRHAPINSDKFLAACEHLHWLHRRANKDWSPGEGAL